MNRQRDEIDVLEKQREGQHAERTLRAFGEILASSFGGVPDAITVANCVMIQVVACRIIGRMIKKIAGLPDWFWTRT